MVIVGPPTEESGPEIRWVGAVGDCLSVYMMGLDGLVVWEEEGGAWVVFEVAEADGDFEVTEAGFGSVLALVSSIWEVFWVCSWVTIWVWEGLGWWTLAGRLSN